MGNFCSGSAPRSVPSSTADLVPGKQGFDKRRCQAPEKGVGALSAEEEKKVRITDLGSFHELWLRGRREGEGSRSRAKRRGREASASSQRAFLTINF